jgi:hypothetical protein
MELIHLYLEGGKDYFLKVVMQNDRNFVELIQPYLKAGKEERVPEYYLLVIALLFTSM